MSSLIAAQTLQTCLPVACGQAAATAVIRHLHWNNCIRWQFCLFDRLFEFPFLNLRSDVHADDTTHHH